MASWVEKVNILARYKSDHCPVLLDYNLFEIKRGRGFSKLNNRILFKKEYLDEINELIEATQKTFVSENPQQLWEAVKIGIIASSKEYCKHRAMNRKLIISQLEEQVEKFSQIDIENLTSEEINIWEHTQQDLEDMKDEKMQGVILRCKQKWYSEGQSSTKYFYNVEKSRAGAKGMSSLIKNGEVIRDPRLILEEQFKFHQKFYRSEEIQSFDYINKGKIHISTETRQMMEGRLTINEVRLAIKQMKRNKSPGLDGPTVEFYIMFMTKLENMLLNAFNAGFESRHLHDSALRGVISLIPKKQKDTRFVKNLRPIALLNIDYKILEKCLANRIKPALNYIIDMDQKGFMSGRRICCNIRRILDMINLIEDDYPALIVFNRL